MERSDRRQPAAADVRSFVTELYGHDMHAKRVESLAGATLGVMQAGSLAVALIGQALAQARGLVTKHAVKQVDRMLSNHGIDVWDSLARWIPFQIGERRDILVAMDWTEFDHDDQATLVLSMVTGHGRAAPLLWLSVWKDELKNRRNDFESLPSGRRSRTRGTRACGGWSSWCHPRAASPSWPIAASAIRSCSRIWPNSASAT